MSLIQDAIGDARQLREVAEEAAKKKIIEALTPKVKSLIEQQLDSEEGDGEIDFEDIETSALEDIEFVEDDSEAVDDFGSFEPIDSLEVETSVPTDSQEIEYEYEVGTEQNPTVSVNAAGDVNIHLSDQDQEDEEDLLLDNPAGMMDEFTEAKKYVQMANELIAIVNEGNYSNKDSRRLMAASDKLVHKFVNLSERGIFRGNSQAARRLLEAVSELTRAQSLLEKKTMTSRKRIFEMGGEMDEYDELQELDVALEIEADPEEREALAALGMDDLDVEVVLAGDDDEDDEDDDMEFELDLGDEEEEDDMGEEDVEKEDSIEVSESALRREIRRMRQLREADGSPDAAALDDFGDGSDEGDVFDVDEETLLNVLADELGRADVPAPKVESRHRRRTHRRMSEARRPRRQPRRPAPRLDEAASLRRQLQEAHRANEKMKKNLQEMNLFNAKLLYVNKIMQNRNVTPKQQRAIVEALDNAKTLRECKLLYKTFTTSLKKRGSLTESRVRLAGSSSRSTPSAQPASNGVETNRWAVLAGINGDTE